MQQSFDFVLKYISLLALSLCISVKPDVMKASASSALPEDVWLQVLDMCDQKEMILIGCLSKFHDNIRKLRKISFINLSFPSESRYIEPSLARQEFWIIFFGGIIHAPRPIRFILELPYGILSRIFIRPLMWRY